MKMKMKMKTIQIRKKKMNNKYIDMLTSRLKTASVKDLVLSKTSLESSATRKSSSKNFQR